MELNYSLLAAMPIFNRITEKEIPPLLQCLGTYLKTYKKSELIILEGNTLEHIGVVIHGEVQMIKEDLWGTKSILALMSEGEIFGETFVCAQSDISFVSFQAVTDCRVLFISFRKVLGSCSQSCPHHQKLIENMLTLIARKNIQLMEKLEIISKKTMRERIITYLSLQAQKSEKMTFTLSMGRLELADYLCVDRSALTRELAHMKKDGLIDYDKNTFTLKSD